MTTVIIIIIWVERDVKVFKQNFEKLSPKKKHTHTRTPTTHKNQTRTRPIFFKVPKLWKFVTLWKLFFQTSKKDCKQVVLRNAPKIQKIQTSTGTAKTKYDNDLNIQIFSMCFGRESCTFTGKHWCEGHGWCFCENAFVCRSGTRRAKRKQQQKDAQWIEKSLWACVGRVMLVTETRLCYF